MSFAALAWAAKQRPGNLAAKMILLGLANYADEHGCAYPSTAALAEFGDMDHKTATVALDRLVSLKLIVDSGEREGRTRQIKVYRLALESQPKTEAFQKRKPSEKVAKAPQKRGTDTVRTKIPSGDKSPSGSRAKISAHPLPANWEPEPFGIGTKCRGIVDGWPPGEIEFQLEHFRAHHSKKADQFSSWQDAWKTWALNSRKFGNGSSQLRGNSGQGAGRADGFAAVLREVANS